MTSPIPASLARQRVRRFGVLACVGLAALMAGCKHTTPDTTAIYKREWKAIIDAR